MKKHRPVSEYHDYYFSFYLCGFVAGFISYVVGNVISAFCIGIHRVYNDYLRRYVSVGFIIGGSSFISI